MANDYTNLTPSTFGEEDDHFWEKYVLSGDSRAGFDDPGDTEWSNLDKLRMYSLIGEKVGDMASAPSRITASIGDIQARGAQGLPAGSSLEVLKDLPSSTMPDILEVYAQREKQKEKNEWNKLLRTALGGEDDVPEYGGNEDWSSMGPLDISGAGDAFKGMGKGKNVGADLIKMGMAAQRSSQKKEGEADIEPDIKPEIEQDIPFEDKRGLDYAKSIPGAIGEDFMSMFDGSGGEDDVPFSMDVANSIADAGRRAMEKGGNGDIPLEQDLRHFHWASEEEPEDYLGEVLRSGEIMSKPEVRSEMHPSQLKQIIESEQIDIDADFDRNRMDRLEESALAAVERSKKTRAEIMAELAKKRGDVSVSVEAPGETPSDKLTKVAAAMSVSDKLDFLEDKEGNKKVKEMEKQIQALKEQKQDQQDVEWVRLQQQKLKDLAVATPQITPIRWG